MSKRFGKGILRRPIHTLAAALHCAIPLQEEALLTALEQRAPEQQEWIDMHAAIHLLSSQSAALHGPRSIYASLVKQIQTRQLIQWRHPPHL